MNFSLFENDGTLGELYHAVTFAGSARGSAWQNADAQRGEWLRVLAAAGWGITSLSFSRPSEFANDVNFTLVLNAACDNRSNATLAAGLKGTIEASGIADRMTIRHVRSETCGGNPDLVGGGSVFTPTVRTPQTIKAGALATVNVPISFDDDPAVKGNENIGWLDTIKGLDTTTMVLLGLAAVLVLKRL